MKKFWKKTEGFTLVELVVVIAILGILAGVGTVGYSGYVKKANQAADRQLVGYINQAYAIACVQNGVNAAGTTADDITVTNKKIAEGALNVTAPATPAELAEKIETAFELNYPEYTTAEFKVANKLKFSSGVFIPDFDVVAGAADYTELKTLLAASSFNGNLEVVTDQVDFLTSALSTSLKDGFVSFSGGRFDAYLQELGIDTSDTDKVSQAAILYLGQNAGAMTDDGIENVSAKFNSLIYSKVMTGRASIDEAMVAELTASTGSSLASYAAIYAFAEGMALADKELGNDAAYNALHNAELKDGVSVLNAVSSAFNNVSDAALEKLYNGNTAADMNAYFNTLRAVNENADDLEKVVKDGDAVIDSDIVVDMIDQVKGE